MLQTRLKEAEVAEAARDPSVRVVDAAIAPTAGMAPAAAERHSSSGMWVSAWSGRGVLCGNTWTSGSGLEWTCAARPVSRSSG